MKDTPEKIGLYPPPKEKINKFKCYGVVIYISNRKEEEESLTE
jgi:hypothetical protein